MLPASAAFFSLILGCQGSLNAEANASADANGEGSASADAELSAEGQGEMARRADSGSGVVAGLTDMPPSSRVLLGARHDLRLVPGKATVSCQCLGVALGGSRSSGMMWSTSAPAIDDSTQLAIALSSEGTACKDEPKGSLGASYWGYKISGNDVIVLVESASGGHPLTSGAVIPRPVGTGQVYVAPAAQRLPYGKALDGKGACKIGNPGQPRPTGFTELELGIDSSSGTRGKAAPSIDDTPTTIDMTN